MPETVIAFTEYAVYAVTSAQFMCEHAWPILPLNQLIPKTHRNYIDIL